MEPIKIIIFVMKILIAGDFCQKNRVDTVIRNQQYDLLFGDIQQFVNSADYSIVNFEFPIVVNAKEIQPIKKNGPNLRGTIDAIGAIKYAGFRCCTLANNHILDQGGECCVNTKKKLESSGIDTVGCGNNIEEAKQILYKTILNKRVAIINCCEHEFSIATKENAGANPLNPINQYYDIEEAQKKADYVLVIVHGGHELFQLPSPRMQEVYRFFIDAGADAVVNGHQHCFSGYEFYNGKPIIYGLGNLCFDNPKKKHDIWNEGYMVELEFLDNNISLKLHPYTQCDDNLGVHMLKNRESFDEKIAELNNIISSGEALKEAIDDYYKSTEGKYIIIHEPYNNKWLKKLYSYHLLPSFISKKRMLKMLNFIECESQRDRHIAAIKDKLKI